MLCFMYIKCNINKANRCIISHINYTSIRLGTFLKYNFVNTLWRQLY